MWASVGRRTIKNSKHFGITKTDWLTNKTLSSHGTRTFALHVHFRKLTSTYMSQQLWHENLLSWNVVYSTSTQSSTRDKHIRIPYMSRSSYGNLDNDSKGVVSIKLLCVIVILSKPHRGFPLCIGSPASIPDIVSWLFFNVDGIREIYEHLDWGQRSKENIPLIFYNFALGGRPDVLPKIFWKGSQR